MTTYKHKSQHLNLQIAEEIVKITLKGTGSIACITKCVLEHHTQHGGLPLASDEILHSPYDSVDAYMRGLTEYVLYELNEKGYVEHNSDEGTWQIYEYPLRVFGEGEGAVYVFYDDRDAILHKTSDGRWACNIGYTEHDVSQRVCEQTKQWTQHPTIALILKTDTPKDLEEALHYLLKRCGCWRKDLKDKGAGREWFDTTPDKVLMLYKHIQLCYERRLSIYELYRSSK
ncbi:GIY-YIG nuclease family protein [Candidatus Poribacteria bacterium]|nr:GIY-YIG nuclease family protein [Candidatus Poribacteria bacterium]